jgi:TRAP-type C4-dicarboxylate transport system permease small subunit
MRYFVDHFEEYALLFLFPAMVLVVFTATLARYFNLFPMFWGEELARYIMVFMAYIGTGLGMKTGAHIGVSTFTDHIRSRRGRIVAEVFRLLVIVGFCLMIMYYYTGIIDRQIMMEQTTPALYLPMWLPYLAVPIGMFLVCARAIEAFFKFTCGQKSLNGGAS